MDPSVAPPASAPLRSADAASLSLVGTLPKAHQGSFQPGLVVDSMVWRKIDMRILPLVTTMCLVGFVDKTNIGNAKLQGLTTQLGLTGHMFNTILTMNFIANCICAVPANLVLKRVRPSIWLPGIMVLWSIITSLTGLVKTYPQLLAARVCLGVVEAGITPGVLYYLTLWYPRHMLQYRIALFWGGATFAGAFSGLLAYGLSFMSGLGGLLGWSWIFIVEGIISFAAGVIACLLFVDFPDTASFLNATERAYIVDRIKYDTSSVGEEEGFRMKHLYDALLDWQVWAACLIDISISLPVYGISFFLPSIINGFGFQPAVSQLLSVPPYVVATIALVVWASWSDKIRKRSPSISLGLALCLVGYAINVSNVTSLGVRYFGTCLVVVGGYAGFPGVPSWLGNNLVGHYKRGIGLAIQAVAAQVGGIIASNIYRAQDAPRYVLGHMVELAFVGFGLCLVPIVALLYAYLNRRRDASHRAMGTESVVHTPESLRALGDRAPDFRYTL